MEKGTNDGEAGEGVCGEITEGKQNHLLQLRHFYILEMLLAPCPGSVLPPRAVLTSAAGTGAAAAAEQQQQQRGSGKLHVPRLLLNQSPKSVTSGGLCAHKVSP